MNYAYLLVLSQTYLQEYLLSNVYIGFKQINVNCILQLQNVSHVVYGLGEANYPQNTSKKVNSLSRGICNWAASFEAPFPVSDWC